MGKLIAMLGNCGAGKTSLANHLAQKLGLQPYLEQHRDRLYHSQLYHQQQNAVANQVDFLLSRAEQELQIRAQPRMGIQDGGLEQDYVIFTKLFYAKGLLSAADFQLCTRLYNLLRAFLPLPDLILHLSADLPILEQRRAQRQRPEDIVCTQDLPTIEKLLNEWLASSPPVRVIHLNTNDQSLYSSAAIAQLEEIISTL